MLTKVTSAMGHWDSLYRLSGTIQLDDAFVGGKHKGKRGRGAEGKPRLSLHVKTSIERQDLSR
jgi:hypothetical protein